MKFAAKKWVLVFIVLGAAGWFAWHSTRPVEGQKVSSPVAARPTASKSGAAIPDPQIPRPVEPVLREQVRVEVAAVVAPRTEVEATHQMIAAHAALRDPRVADPDSAENRMILQTMVLKALANRAPSTARQLPQPSP